jgi:electron transport complex protein RnfG
MCAENAKAENGAMAGGAAGNGTAGNALPEKPRGGFIGQAWLVILLALLYGGGLGGVHVALSKRIEENRRNEIYSVIPSLVPGAERAMTEEVLITGAGGRATIVYKANASDSSLVGWVLRGRGQGFADVVELLVGVDAEVTKITGMYVLGQKETPGLGDYMTSPEWRSQFAGKPATSPLAVVKGEPVQANEIRALTGATISSVAVSDIVNATIADTRAAILKQGRE